MTCATPASRAASNGIRCGSRSCPGTPAPARSESGSSPSSCGPPPGKCLTMQATLCGPSVSPCSPVMYARTSRAASPRPRRTSRTRDTTSARRRDRRSDAGRDECRLRGTRGARCRRTRAPALRRRSQPARSAPATLENPLPLMLVAGLSPKPCRGSDEIVTGIEPRALGRLLHPVVPLRQHGGPRPPVDVEVRQALIADEAPVATCEIASGSSPTSPSSGTTRP